MFFGDGCGMCMCVVSLTVTHQTNDLCKTHDTCGTRTQAGLDPTQFSQSGM